MNIIAISGKAGSGKDTIADYLVREHGFVKIGLADPMKRFCKEIFGFSDEQLWGPSERRNAGDPRWERVYHDGQMTVGLTPRHALQRLGTEYGRAMHPDVWIRYALKHAREVLENDRAVYHAKRAKVYCRSGGRTRPTGVVISDARFKNELDAVRAAGGKLWRVVRPGPSTGAHASETEQDEIPNSYFDQTFANTLTLDWLCSVVRDTLQDQAA